MVECIAMDDETMNRLVTKARAALERALECPDQGVRVLGASAVLRHPDMMGPLLKRVEAMRAADPEFSKLVEQELQQPQKDDNF